MAAHSVNSAAGFRAILKRSHQARAQSQYTDCGERHVAELLLKNI